MSLLQVTAPSRRRPRLNVGLAIVVASPAELAWSVDALQRAVAAREPEIPLSDYVWTVTP